jgi:predicted Zn-dependent peptidase
MYLDEPQHQVQELLNATLWPEQPLGRPITGTNEVLDRISREALTDFLRSHYVANRSLIVAAGQVQHRRLVRAAREYERRFRAGPVIAFAPAWSRQERPAVRLHTKPTEQTQLALGIRGCSRHDPRRFPVRLLNTILGENMSSRLFQVLREDRGLAYSVYTTPSFFEDTGDFVIYAGLDTDNLPRALRLIMVELRRIVEKPPKPAELRRARDYVIGQIDLSLESTENRMNWVGEQLLGYGAIHSPAQFKRRLLKVTPEEVQRAARELFRPERVNLALVSPLKSDRNFRRLLVL